MLLQQVMMKMYPRGSMSLIEGTHQICYKPNLQVVVLLNKIISTLEK